MSTRYAIYFTPPADASLAEASWLERNAFANTLVPRPVNANLSSAEIANQRQPRAYTVSIPRSRCRSALQRARQKPPLSRRWPRYAPKLTRWSSRAR